MRRVVIASLLAAACAPDPTLSVTGDGTTVLCVGQRASLRVTHADPDDSQLELASFVLTDAAKRMLRGPAAPGLELTGLSPWEVGFAVPGGVAPGPATLAIGTKRGPVFSAGLALERVIAVRDGSGKVWLTAISGAEGAITSFGELTPAQAGSGAGRLAIGPAGRLLALAGAELRLASLERPPRVSAPVALPAATRDVALTARNETLIANDQGLLLAERPAGAIDGKTVPKLAAKAILERPTLAIAVDRSGWRGAALVVEAGTPARYQIALLDLQASPPAVLTRVSLPWSVDAGATLDLALDGSAAVAVSSAQGAVAILRAGAAAATELAFPGGQPAPASIAATRTPDLFQIALRGTRGLARLRLEGGGKFETPIDLGSLPAESGAPVAVAASENDETVVLLERELYLIPGAGKPGRALKPPSGLFADKAKAEPGVSLAIQP